MIGSSDNFLTYSPCLDKDKVRIANGSLSSIKEKGLVCCTSLLSLPSTLHIPSFPHNLLSVSALTYDLNCKVEFYFCYCVLQDLSTKKMIGYNRIQDGLYLLDISPDKHQALLYSSTSTFKQLIQWHR